MVIVSHYFSTLSAAVHRYYSCFFFYIFCYYYYYYFCNFYNCCCNVLVSFSFASHSLRFSSSNFAWIVCVTSAVRFYIWSIVVKLQFTSASFDNDDDFNDDGGCVVVVVVIVVVVVFISLYVLCNVAIYCYMLCIASFSSLRRFYVAVAMLTSRSWMLLVFYFYSCSHVQRNVFSSYYLWAENSLVSSYISLFCYSCISLSACYLACIIYISFFLPTLDYYSVYFFSYFYS